MSDLYTIDEVTQTLTTATCQLRGNTLHNKGGVTYEQVLTDLCRCLLAAIAADEGQAKEVIAYALYLVTQSVLGLGEEVEGL